MKKICYVDEDGRFGGPQQRMMLVASELCKLGIKIDFVIPAQEVEVFRKKLDEFKLNYFQLNINRLSLKPIFFFKYIFFFFMKYLYLLVFLEKKNMILFKLILHLNLKLLLHP